MMRLGDLFRVNWDRVEASYVEIVSQTAQRVGVAFGRNLVVDRDFVKKRIKESFEIAPELCFSAAVFTQTAVTPLSVLYGARVLLRLYPHLQQVNQETLSRVVQEINKLAENFIIPLGTFAFYSTVYSLYLSASQGKVELLGKAATTACIYGFCMHKIVGMRFRNQ